MYDHALLKLAVAVCTPLAIMACQLIVRTLNQLIHVVVTKGKNRTVLLGRISEKPKLALDLETWSRIVLLRLTEMACPRSNL